MRTSHLAAMCLFLWGGQAVAAAVADLSCGESRMMPLTRSESELEIRVGSQAQWIELEELGQQIEVSGAPHEAIRRIAIPLRYGWHLVAPIPAHGILVRRVEKGNENSATRVRVHCDPLATASPIIHWMMRAATFSKKIESPIETTAFAALLGDARALAADAPDEKTRSFGTHLVAQTLVMGGRYSDSAEAFARAKSAWSDIGDHRRAFVALVAEAEDEHRIGNFAKALDLVRGPENGVVKDSYFRIRLKNTGCLAKQALGRIDEALICFRSTTEAYRKIGELSEYALSLQTYANALREAGKLRQADSAIESGIANVSGEDMRLNRGRLLILAGDLAMRRGDVQRALRLLRDAIDDFEAAKVLRWQINGWLAIADLYAHLGANTEARFALMRAFDLLSPRDAPSRIALALRIAVDVERDADNPTLARWLARAAEQEYRAMGMRLALDAVRLVGAALDLDSGNIDEAEQVLSSTAHDLSMYDVVRHLLSARLALSRKEPDVAFRLLAKVRRAPISLRDNILLDLVSADYYASMSDMRSARAVLAAATARVNALANSVGNALLSYLVRRQQEPLRRAGVGYILASSEPDAPRRLFEWAASTSPAIGARSERRPSRGASASAFDAAIATDLLARSKTERTNAGALAERSLLALLSDGEERRPKHERSLGSGVVLESLQLKLRETDALVAIIEGPGRAYCLWITSNEVAIVGQAETNELRAGISDLLDLLESPGAELSKIDIASRRLSRLLFGDIADRRVPERLFLLDDGIASDIPFSVLRWPSTDELLEESTSVAFVRLVPSLEMDSRPPRAAKFFLAAMNGNLAPLPSLPAAKAEQRNVRIALAKSGTPVLDEEGSSVDELLAALAESESWVHVAAHGTADPRRIGYSGIWLESTAGHSSPDFVSWIDVLSTSVRSSLVVLDACELARGRSGRNGGPSFAAAVSMAGGSNVVAGLWPVSDAATSIWVPSFYESLSKDPGHDVARAVLAAQRALRQRRAFRHPFFWAGLTVVSRWPVLPSATADANHGEGQKLE